MRMGQGVRTGLGHGASPVSYRHNFLVIFLKNSKLALREQKVTSKYDGSYFVDVRTSVA